MGIEYYGQWNRIPFSYNSPYKGYNNKETIDSMEYSGNWQEYTLNNIGTYKYTRLDDLITEEINSSSIIKTNNNWFNHNNKYIYNSGLPINIEKNKIIFNGVWTNDNPYLTRNITSNILVPFTGTNIEIETTSGPNKSNIKFEIYDLNNNLIKEQIFNNYSINNKKIFYSIGGLKNSNYILKVIPIVENNRNEMDFYNAFVYPSIEYEFNSKNLEFIAMLYTHNGIVDIFLDGIFHSSLDLYSPTFLIKNFKLFENLSFSNHRVTIISTRKKNTSSKGNVLNFNSIKTYSSVLSLPCMTKTFSGNTFSLDFVSSPNFGVLDVYINDNFIKSINLNLQKRIINQIFSVSETNFNNIKIFPRNNKNIAIKKNNYVSSESYATCKFYGNYVSYIADKNFEMGEVEVYIDNILKGTYNLNSSISLIDQEIVSFNNLKNGEHILKIKPKNNSIINIKSIKKKYFDENFINKLKLLSNNKFYKYKDRLSPSKILEYANMILDNYIVVFPRKFSPIKYTDNINWEIDPYNNVTWRLYFETLYMVNILLHAYEVSNNTQYINKAINITNDWIDKHPVLDLNLPKVPLPPYQGNYTYAWYDHAVSYRSLNLIFLLETIIKIPNINNDFIIKLLNSIYEHADWLYRDKNYPINNHGYMMDLALINISLNLSQLEESNIWFNKAKQRILDSLIKDTTNEFIHKEHSTEYHLFAYNLFTSIEELVNRYNKTIGEDYNNYLNNMEKNFLYMLKPDGTIVTVGDTERGTVGVNNLKNENLKFAMTNGSTGLKPNISSIVFPNSGYAFFRDNWYNSNNFDKSTYISFTNSFFSPVHKQADNLSFTLYSLGEDLIIDPGKYSYNATPMTTYIKSSLSHNTISVDNNSFFTASSNQQVKDKYYEGKWKTLSYNLTNEYDFIKAEHELFSGVKVIRELLFIKPNILIIFDNTYSNENHSYQQIFNLANDIHSISYSKNLLKSKSKSGIDFRINQLKSVENSRYYYGSENPIRGFYSNTFEKIDKCHQIEFEKNGKNVEFVTLISMIDNRYYSIYGGMAKNITYSEDSNNRYINYMYNNLNKQISLTKN